MYCEMSVGDSFNSVTRRRSEGGGRALDDVFMIDFGPNEYAAQ